MPDLDPIRAYLNEVDEKTKAEGKKWRTNNYWTSNTKKKEKQKRKQEQKEEKKDECTQAVDSVWAHVLELI